MNSTDEKTEKNKAGTPGWATAPFKWFLKETKELDQLLSLAIRGISVLQAMPKVVDAIAYAEGKQDEPKHADDKKMAQEMARLAHDEVEENFPLLHAHNLVAIWSLLEALIRTFVAEWVANYPEAMAMPAVSKLRIRLGDYHNVTEEEKPLYIAELLEKDLGAGLRNGVDRFEAMLEPFGLSGEVSKETKKTIFELGQIRNALVHRAGHADRTLVDSCPWLHFKLGERIKVSRAIYSRCFHAACDYTVQLIVRVGEKFGVDMSKFRHGSGKG